MSALMPAETASDDELIQPGRNLFESVNAGGIALDRELPARGRHKVSGVRGEVRVRMGGCQTPLEDDEDDDPTEADGDEADGSFAEDKEAAAHRLHGHGPGCIIADSDKGTGDEGEMDESV